MTTSAALVSERVGPFIRRRRRAAKLTQAALGRLAGLHLHHVFAVENSTKSARVATIEQLASGFGLKLSELFREIEQEGGEGK
jgi:transcriptional regulator with XRE-family HTH domain